MLCSNTLKHIFATIRTRTLLLKIEAEILRNLNSTSCSLQYTLSSALTKRQQSLIIDTFVLSSFPLWSGSFLKDCATLYAICVTSYLSSTRHTVKQEILTSTSSDNLTSKQDGWKEHADKDSMYSQTPCVTCYTQVLWMKHTSDYVGIISQKLTLWWHCTGSFARANIYTLRLKPRKTQTRLDSSFSYIKVYSKGNSTAVQLYQSAQRCKRK